MKRHNSLFVFILIFLFALTACEEEVYTPKPKGFFRIDMPKKEYQSFQADYCPFTFQYPAYGTVEKKEKFFNDAPDHPCWLNISFPYFNGKLHLTYVDIDTPEKLEQSINDAYKYSMKHVQKADFIDETTILTDQFNGKLFDLGGDVASSIQFYVTDSATNFLRGSLYFNEHPNADSLRPVIEFLREDISAMMKSVIWE